MTLRPISSIRARSGAVSRTSPAFALSRTCSAFRAPAIAHVPAREASLVSLLEPLLNPVWVARVVGEVPSGWTLAGGALVLSALLLLILGLEALEGDLCISADRCGIHFRQGAKFFYRHFIHLQA